MCPYYWTTGADFLAFTGKVYLHESVLSEIRTPHHLMILRYLAMRFFPANFGFKPTIVDCDRDGATGQQPKRVVLLSTHTNVVLAITGHPGL